MKKSKQYTPPQTISFTFKSAENGDTHRIKRVKLRDLKYTDEDAVRVWLETRLRKFVVQKEGNNFWVMRVQSAKPDGREVLSQIGAITEKVWLNLMWQAKFEGYF